VSKYKEVANKTENPPGYAQQKVVENRHLLLIRGITLKTVYALTCYTDICKHCEWLVFT